MRFSILSRQDNLSNEVACKIKKRTNLEYDDINPDYVVAVGGDGTILSAVHKYPNAVVFGVHTGHLGFYANYSVENIDDLVNDINTGHFHIENTNLLSCKIYDSKNNLTDAFALNEITIVTPPRTLILDVFINGEYLERFRGTGFCVSTPSGSTAYNKSLHGSVIDPQLDTIQLTEIAGINSNSYRTLSSPLVLSNRRKIKLKALMAQEVFITVDHESYTINDFESIEIGYEGKVLKMAFHEEESFLKRISRTFLISKE